MWIVTLIENGLTVAILAAGAVIYTATATEHELSMVQRAVQWHNEIAARALLGSVAA